MELTKAFSSIEEVATWSKHAKGPGRHLLTGLSGSAKTLFLAEEFASSEGSLIVVCDDLYHAHVDQLHAQDHRAQGDPHHDRGQSGVSSVYEHADRHDVRFPAVYDTPNLHDAVKA